MKNKKSSRSMQMNLSRPLKAVVSFHCASPKSPKTTRKECAYLATFLTSPDWTSRTAAFVIRNKTLQQRSLLHFNSLALFAVRRGAFVCFSKGAFKGFCGEVFLPIILPRTLFLATQWGRNFGHLLHLIFLCLFLNGDVECFTYIVIPKEIIITNKIIK
ncbi:hypothetical protein CEXT_40031 [Caerostris extrusa]|uniref:Uncharacterized protein n=1 Tax=Caerostris extrusa TaxID=172846 RepID=A0AAV4MRQ0_CAEEX|nr:hypothetical protein CEXT_40031 [Caerostris extrusa]